ncbi:ATP-dependent DNA helicase [Aphis craccivora]|uniref:ATP-dependent DNA helicase n=1 Tax=Aphis craccivora TaxID=307492 RepID=A0A6G0YCG1_APHCR|nr:ATP-dependent DNA helicase [Aphis craccivora]
MVTKLQKARAMRKKKYQESTQSKYVVESNNSTFIEPNSINTVQEVVKKTVKRKKPKSKQLIGKLKMPLVKGRCTADKIIKWVLNYRKQNVFLLGYTIPAVVREMSCTRKCYVYSVKTLPVIRRRYLYGKSFTAKSQTVIINVTRRLVIKALVTKRFCTMVHLQILGVTVFGQNSSLLNYRQ